MSLMVEIAVILSLLGLMVTVMFVAGRAAVIAKYAADKVENYLLHRLDQWDAKQSLVSSTEKSISH